MDSKLDISNVTEKHIFNKPPKLEYKEYYIIHSYIIYKIIIAKNENEIIIKCKNYMITFNSNDLSLLTNVKFDSIEKTYEYISNIFEENNYLIKNIIKKKEIQFILKTNKKEIEIVLLYKEYNNDFIINEINKLKIENEKMKKEINILKGYHNNGSNPKDIKLLSNITKESYAEVDLDNTFTVFKSINDLLYLIYSTKNKSIICQDLNSQKIIKELKKCHNEYITNLRHYLDKTNIKDIKDLILSISSNDNNLKVWNVNNWECIINIPNANKDGYLYSACFLNNNDEILILTSNAIKKGNSENIKAFDLKGKKIKEINNSNRSTFFIDIYYDDIVCKNYILTGNINYVKSYDYNKNEIYRKYHEKNDNKCHGSIIIKNNEEIIKLIESCADGHIRIWNFHLGLLLNKIKVGDGLLYGICLWNNNYLFVGVEDKTVKLVDLNNGLTVKYLSGHNNVVLCIKKLIHPQYGEWLISQGYKDDKIKIWNNKN